jgi:Skp family chaperone for outer membrane proteins
MIFGYFILFISVVISAIAAWYSVVGLTAIFAAAVVPVMIMGGALEAGKIVATVWLHNNWKRVGYAFKLYLIPAIIFLMLLTSMGIFGFLSKAHGDQSLVSGDAMARVAIFDEKIKISKDNIDANRKALKQMDEAVDQVMGRSSDEKGADKAVSIRRAQQKERVRLQSEIAAEQKTITSLSEEAAPLRAEFRKVEAEVGPIKYIAALIYGDAASQNMLEAAVRWVIILIVVVFDPLALTLILAANKQLEWARKGKGGWVHDEEDRPVEEQPAVVTPAVEDAEPTVEKVATEATPTEPVVELEHPLTEEEREAQEMEAVEQFFWRGRMIAKALDAEEAERLAKEGNAQLAELEAEPDVDSVLASLEQAKVEEARLQAEAQQQQELLNTLAEELVIYSTQLADEKDRKAELETQLQQSEQLKTDLKSAYDATSATNQLLAQQKAKTDRDLVDAGNNAARLRIDLDKRDQEIEKLNGWVTQLQADLMAAITVAEERNSKVNELASLLPPPPSVVVEEVIASPVIEQVVAEVEPEQEAVIPRPTNTDEAAYDPTLGFEEKYFANYNKPAQADDVETASHGDAGFGSAFPIDPVKSDVFLRIDYLPSRLYKFNGTKWIEIDKSSNDRLAYNQAYIEHLIEKVRSGEYDIDDLNDAERNEINQYLRDHDTKL